MASKPQLNCRGEMDILSRVTTKIGQHLELDMVLETALSEIFAALNVRHGCIYLWDDDAETLTIAVQRQLNDNFMSAKRTINPGEGCAGTAAVTQEMFAPTKAERRFVCRESQDMLGLDCLAAVPIVSRGEVLGVLELFAPVARRLSTDERELIEAINNQLAVAIKNAQIHSGLQHALENTKKLLQATETITATLEFDTILEYLARLACELTHVSRPAISIYHQKTKEIEFVLSPSPDVPKGYRRPIAGRSLKSVYEAGRTIALYDLSDLPDLTRKSMEKNHVRSVLIVPLRFAGQTLGALYLDEPNRQHKFTNVEIELAEGIARHAAAAIQNARSFESTQRALANAQALLEAAGMVATILDPDILLNQLAKLLPKLTGISRSAIALCEAETNELTLVVPPTPEIPRGALCSLDEGILKTALFKGESVVIDDLSRLPDSMCWMLETEGVKSLLLTPLHYGAEVMGLLMLYDGNRPHEFSVEEINLAEAIAHHAAIGVTNARSFSEQRRIAETLQQSFIPSRPPALPGIQFGVGYRSASESAFIGGDFYDFLSIDDRLGICIGDVSGRGIETASLAGLAKSTIRAFAFERKTPSAVVDRTNYILAQQTGSHQFITLNYGLLDLKSRTFEYVSAGHPPPLLLAKDGRFLPVINQLPIGMYDDTRYRQQTIDLPAGSFLIFYTDGLIEARQNGRLFGAEGLLEAAHPHKNQGAQALVDGIIKVVDSYTGHKLMDDMAIVALHIA